MSTTTTRSPSTKWVGIDVSAESFDACIYPADKNPDPAAIKRLPTQSFARTRDGLAQLLAQLDGHGPVCLVMESTGRYSSQLGEWVCQAGGQATPAIVNPRRIHAHAKALGMRSKTDATDARVIASYGATFRPKPWRPMADDYQALQTVTRVRQGLVEQRTRIHNQARDLKMQSLPSAVRASLLLSLDAVGTSLSHEIEQLEKQLGELLDRHPGLKRDAELADTVPGVGTVVALTVMAEMGDLRRFASRKEAETYAGLNVAVRHSGKSVHSTVGLAKEGSNRVRRILYTAAMAASKGKTPLGEHFRQMVGRGKARKVALGALMRKILALIRRIVIDETPYTVPQEVKKMTA
jgi:transposase